MGVCYNNINMANLLFDGGQLRLTGLGLANQEGLRLDERFANHDVNFWAPEAIAREPLDNKSDLYSAGVLLYTLLTGQFPFDSGSLRLG